MSEAEVQRLMGLHDVAADDSADLARSIGTADQDYWARKKIASRAALESALRELQPAGRLDQATADWARNGIADFVGNYWPDRKYTLAEIEERIRSIEIRVSAAPSATTAPAAPEVPADARDAARDVLAERRRRVEAEGWTPEHDDQYQRAQLRQAAACYALFNTIPTPTMWPWAPEWWKPSADTRRNLVKAGALILAEIERLDRAAMAAPTPQEQKP